MLYTDEQIEAAIREAKGNISGAARLLGCDRGTVALRAKDNPALQEAIVEGREARIDRAEEVVDEVIDCADKAEALKAATYILRTIGRSRGYGDKLEVEHGGRVEIHAKLPESMRKKPDGDPTAH